MTERERSRRIGRYIRYGDYRLRQKLPFLQHQDALGLGIVVCSAVGFVLVGGLYIAGLIPFWACIIINALLSSFLHEMEHDLIHNLFFKKSPKMQNILFWTVWLFRANTVNPWFRKVIHLLHHKHSGHMRDLEERAIGNGMPIGLHRFLVTVDPLLSVIIQGPRLWEEAQADIISAKKVAPHIIRPFGEIFQLSWYSFLIFSLCSLVNWALGSPFHEPQWLTPVHHVLNTAAVVYLIPSWLRQTSIQIISSNMHYYGDVEGLFKQTQVLDSWLVFPLNLFCFNFGATHGIHHFVVNQPFYLRQAVFPFVRPALRKYGIRFNDFGSMLRANRYFETATSAQEA